MGTLDVHLLAMALMGTQKHLEQGHFASMVGLDSARFSLAERHILAHAREAQMEFEKSTEELRRLVSLSQSEADSLAERALAALA